MVTKTEAWEIGMKRYKKWTEGKLYIKDLEHLREKVFSDGARFGKSRTVAANAIIESPLPKQDKEKLLKELTENLYF